MPFYDRKCETCGEIRKDLYEPMNDAPDVACECGGNMIRWWVTGEGSKVIGDEIDIEIQHGLCNLDGTPRRYRSREEMNREAKKRGMTNYVVATDHDKHVKRWSEGLPPGVDGRPMSMLSEEEQAKRREEWLKA